MADNITLSRRTSSELVRHDGQDTRVVMVKRQIEVPADLIYEIPGGRGGYLASAFDIFAREMAMQFELGETNKTFNKRGQIASVSAKIKATYYNSRGALCHDEVEAFIDLDALYQETRAKWGRKIWAKTLEEAKKKSANPDFLIAEERYSKAGGNYTEFWERPRKTVTYDEDHTPLIVIELPPDAEVSVHESYMSLRKNALQKAQTVARRTLTQRAMATKSFDKEKNPTGIISIYGAVREVGSKPEDLYGDDMPETAEDVQREAVVEPQEAQPEPKAAQTTRKPSERQPVAKAPEPAQPQGDALLCLDCDKELTEKDAQYFKFRGGQLCYDCGLARKQQARG